MLRKMACSKPCGNFARDTCRIIPGLHRTVGNLLQVLNIFTETHEWQARSSGMCEIAHLAEAGS